MNELEFKQRIRKGGDVSIVTIPLRVMEIGKMKNGDEVIVVLKEKNSRRVKPSKLGLKEIDKDLIKEIRKTKKVICSKCGGNCRLKTGMVEYKFAWVCEKCGHIERAKRFQKKGVGKKQRK